MIVVVGASYPGLELKAKVIAFIEELGHTALDVGCLETNDMDFVAVVKALAAKVKSGEANRGILIGTTGAAEAMAANKIPGIRAAVCHDIQCAHQSVEHDDANVMVLGGAVIGSWVAKDLVQSFLGASFFGTEAFKSRLVQLAEMEAAWSE
jgi:ribose 5-phosphate isomerase B